MTATRMLALDFETFYNGDYSLKKMSTWDYIHDARFDAHTLAAYGEGIAGQLEWVGNPREFDWSQIHGATLLAHNASFDALVMQRLRELGVVPAQFVEAEWLCTADLSAYLRCMRNLKDAAKYLLEIDLDKSTRAAMQGKTGAELQAMAKEVNEYTIADAKCCYLLAQKYLDKWPACEREYSQRLRAACLRGLPVNVARASEAAQSLAQQEFDLRKQIPWAADGEKPLSPKALRLKGREAGIPVPASLSKTDPACIAWFREYADKYPWIKAVRDYRSLTAHLRRVETVHAGVRADGTFPIQIMYMGAQTGRTSAGSTDSSGGKFNPLNMPRKPMFGVDLRNLFEAPDGYTMIVADFAQIEAIMLLWLAKDKTALARVRKTGNVYTAYAQQAGWFSGTDLKKDDPELYQRAKVSVLALGYGSGWRKFRSVAETNYGVVLTEQEAETLVNQFRAANQRIVQYWAEHNAWLQYSANHNDPTHEIALASGRDLVYFEPRWVAEAFGMREIQAKQVQGGHAVRLYGGILVENVVQATARDVLRDARNAVERAGHDVILDVYDELVCMVPESEAKDRKADIERLMVSSSPWTGDCPLGVEAKITKMYCK